MWESMSIGFYLRTCNPQYYNFWVRTCNPHLTLLKELLLGIYISRFALFSLVSSCFYIWTHRYSSWLYSAIWIVDGVVDWSLLCISQFPSKPFWTLHVYMEKNKTNISSYVVYPFILFLCPYKCWCSRIITTLPKIWHIRRWLHSRYVRWAPSSFHYCKSASFEAGDYVMCITSVVRTQY